MSNLILNTPGGNNQVPAGKSLVGAKNNNGTVVNGFTNKLFVFDLESIPTEPFVNEIRASFNDKFVTDYFGNSAVVSTGYGIIYKELTPLLSTTITNIMILDNCNDNSQLYLNVYNENFTRKVCDTTKGTCVYEGIFGEGAGPNSNGHYITFTNGLHLSANTKYQIPIAVVKVHGTNDNNNHLVYSTNSEYARTLTFFFDANNVLNNLSNALTYTTTDHPEIYVYIGADKYRT